MIRKMDHNNMGRSRLGWLDSHFHFSFAEYYNPDNMNFGALRVINDDLIAANTGFDTHPHRDMEIVSYVVDGELSHADNMGNEHTLTRGEVQYMSAGTGVFHSEHNRGDVTTRILQTWVIPDKKGYEPAYGDHRFKWDERKDHWLHMVSPKDGNAPIKVNQDVNYYALTLEAGGEASFPIENGRQAYLVLIEGLSDINGHSLVERDGLETIGEDIQIKALEKSHYLLIEMAV